MAVRTIAQVINTLYGGVLKHYGLIDLGSENQAFYAKIFFCHCHTI